jgi:hypothetical protein
VRSRGKGSLPSRQAHTSHRLVATAHGRQRLGRGQDAGFISREQPLGTLDHRFGDGVADREDARNLQPRLRVGPRSKIGAQTARITVTVWRPGVTTLANPDYRFGGPRSTGNIQ